MKAWFGKFGGQWSLLVVGLVALLAASLAAWYFSALVPDSTSSVTSSATASANSGDDSTQDTPSPTLIAPATPSPKPTTPSEKPTTPSEKPATPSEKPPDPPAAEPSTAPESVTSVSTTCTNPVFVTSDRNGGWSTRGYYVHNNMWNDSEVLGPETLYACSHDNWYVVSNQTNSAGAVKTYPNVHKDYDDVPISSFDRITSTFAATSPHVGIYNVAYDIWTNGVATNGSTEIMIWTENYKQVPAGDKAATVSLGGRKYNVWKTSDSHYIAFVPTAVMTSGSIDLLEMFSWLMSKGWLPANSTLGQIDYGVEIVSTGGKDATFAFTDFSITDG